MAEPDIHDVPTLLKQIDDAEGNDKEVHMLYNNLGLAYTSALIYHKALEAHRQEKIACKRLLDRAPKDVERLVDMSIAYRKCGDAISRVDKLDLGGKVIRDKRVILTAANGQHQKALGMAEKALKYDSNSMKAIREVQASTVSVGQSAALIGWHVGDKKILQLASAVSFVAVKLARDLPASFRPKEKMNKILRAAVNYALALDGLGKHKLALDMLHAVLVHANKADDHENVMRATANLVDIHISRRDFDTARIFAERWVSVASDVRDTHEEATANDKLGEVLSELFEHANARDALERALELHTDAFNRAEIEKRLRIVEENLAKDAAEADALKKCEDRLCRDEMVPADEALLRRKAGNYAFALRRHGKCIEHLGRFMELLRVYKHDCNPEKLGLDKQKHGRAVANLAESYWKSKQFKLAVKWGKEELLVYGDEKAGQAQAWCNLGNYLADYGDKAKGIEALRKSIVIAEECGELHVMRTAQSNLDIELENLEKGNVVNAPGEDEMREVIMVESDPLPNNMEQVLPLISSNLKNSQNQRNGLNPNPTKSTPFGSSSIDLCSGRDDNIPGQASVELSGARSRNFGGDAASSGVFSMSRPMVPGIRSNGDKLCGAQSSATVSRYKDIAELYKKLCGNKSKAVDSPRPREGILAVLREVSAAAMLETDDSKSVQVDMSEKFLNDAELALVIRSLVALSVDRTVELSLARNRLLTARGYSVFLDKMLPRSVVSLDLTGCGVDTACIRALARASDGGTLSNMMSLNLSKNAIGRFAHDAADACADLVNSGGLVNLDISFNLLPPAFLVRFVQRLQTISHHERPRRLAFLDLKLNNARNPAALLEFSNPLEVVQCLVDLSNAVETIMEIDIRACGGGREVRKAIYDARASTGHLNVLVVSEGRLDPDVS